MLLILSLEGIEERPPALSLGQESKNDCFSNLHAVSGEYDGFTYYRKYAWGLLIAHGFPQIHEPPYPPFIIVLIARNLSGRIAASKNLKNHTYARMGPHSVPF